MDDDPDQPVEAGEGGVGRLRRRRGRLGVADAVAQVTYQINKASNADIARLEVCLQNFPSVAGVTLQDSSDEGN